MRMDHFRDVTKMVHFSSNACSRKDNHYPWNKLSRTVPPVPRLLLDGTGKRPF